MINSAIFGGTPALSSDTAGDNRVHRATQADTPASFRGDRSNDLQGIGRNLRHHLGRFDKAVPCAELRQQRRAELGHVDQSVRNRAPEEPRVIHRTQLIEELRLRPLWTFTSPA
jgi:hypothetical protein